MGLKLQVIPVYFVDFRQIQHWITKEKGLKVSFNLVTHNDNMICTTMFPWKTVSGSKKLIHITVGYVIGMLCSQKPFHQLSLKQKILIIPCTFSVADKQIH